MYAVYRNTRNNRDARILPQGTDPGKDKSSCPTPKDFINYTEGKMKGKRKEVLDNHIKHCKNCQDALHGVFGMSKE